MKTKKLFQLIAVVSSTALLSTSCNSTTAGENTTGGATGENASETSFNLFQSIAQIRADVNPSQAFIDFKNDYLKPDQPLTLQFVVDYVQPGKPVVDLKLVEVTEDNLRIAGDPNLSTVENTLILSDIKCTPEELRKMPRALKAGLNFVNKTDFTAVYPVTEEFKTKLKAFNKQFGYEVISESSSIENEVAYVLTGNYQYWDQSELYNEQSFERSKFSDEQELAKIKFYIGELENGSLKEILTLYKAGKLALID